MMRTTKNISITMPPDMLKEAKKVAKGEGRTMSELLREALRRYVIQTQFREAQRFGIQQSKKLGYKRSDINRLVEEYRREKRQVKINNNKGRE